MPAPALTPATLADAALLGAIIGEAFAEDPVSCWTLGSPAMIREAFSTLTADVYLPRGHCMIAGEVAGTLWLPPGGSKQLPLGSMARLGWALARGAPSRHLWRALQVDAVLQRKRPRTPHWYLFAVGVRPAGRGQGLGRAIIGATLAECDRLGLPAFLENTNPRNHALYSSLGFEVLETYSPAPGCPPVTPMWREPVAKRAPSA